MLVGIAVALLSTTTEACSLEIIGDIIVEIGETIQDIADMIGGDSSDSSDDSGDSSDSSDESGDSSDSSDETDAPTAEATDEPATRRRADGRSYSVDFADVGTIHDPLCEWILNDGIDSEWAMLSEENRDAEAQLLLDDCESDFSKPEDIAQCKFYVHAVDAHFTSQQLVEDLMFAPSIHTSMEEYQKCGKVTVELNDAIEDGDMMGVRIVQKADANGTLVDYFELDEPVDNLVIFMNTAVSLGSMISFFIGTTLVKVCRDFHPTDFHWLL